MHSQARALAPARARARAQVEQQRLIGGPARKACLALRRRADEASPGLVRQETLDPYQFAHRVVGSGQFAAEFAAKFAELVPPPPFPQDMGYTNAHFIRDSAHPIRPVPTSNCPWASHDAPRRKAAAFAPTPPRHQLPMD